MLPSKAAMVATSLLTAGKTYENVDLEICHTDGTLERLALRFSPTVEKTQVEEANDPQETARWAESRARSVRHAS